MAAPGASLTAARPRRPAGVIALTKSAAPEAGIFSVDEKRHRLYVSRGDHVQIVDTLSGKVVGDLPGTAGVHGIAIAGDLGLGFTSNGRDTSVTIFDLKTLATIGTVKVTGANPDAIMFDPASGHAHLSDVPSVREPPMPRMDCAAAVLQASPAPCHEGSRSSSTSRTRTRSWSSTWRPSVSKEWPLGGFVRRRGLRSTAGGIAFSPCARTAR